MSDFVTVPVEPTREMLEAAAKVEGATRGIVDRRVYKAMLAARPTTNLTEISEQLVDQNGKPPCDCIAQFQGETGKWWWVQDCSCHNTGDLAEAVSWCTRQNTLVEMQATRPVDELQRLEREIAELKVEIDRLQGELSLALYNLDAALT